MKSTPETAPEVVGASRRELAPLLTDAQEKIYRELLACPGASVEELAQSAGGRTDDIRVALAALQANGLVAHRPGDPRRFQPAPPTLAVGALINRREEELRRARLAATRLEDEFRSGRDIHSAVELVEVVTGPQAVRERSIQLQAGATKELLAFSKPPYSSRPGPQPVETDALRRGVVYRVLYDGAALDEPGLLSGLEHHVARGENARIVREGLPLKLAIADRKMALVPLTTGEPGVEGAALVHSSPLLDALITLFETLWERGVPMIADAAMTGTGKDDALSEADRRLLQMMAAGLKDEAIASHLGVAVRTVSRRVGRLLETLGAVNRFQAGLQASRRGWL